MKSKDKFGNRLSILLILSMGFLFGFLFAILLLLTNTDGILTKNGYIAIDQYNLSQENITQIYKYKCNEDKYKWEMKNIYNGEITTEYIQNCDNWYYEKEVIIQK